MIRVPRKNLPPLFIFPVFAQVKVEGEATLCSRLSQASRHAGKVFVYNLHLAVNRGCDFLYHANPVARHLQEKTVYRPAQERHPECLHLSR